MTLQASLRLFDGMSPALRHINNALNIVVNSFESVQRVSSRAIDSAAIHTAQEEMAEAGAILNGIEESIRKTNQRQQQFNGSIRQGTVAAGNLWNKLRQVAGVYIGLQGANNVIDLSDSMASTEARLSLIVDDGGSLAALEQQIMDSAQRSRASFLDTAAAVAKLGLNAGNAFRGTDEIVSFMEQVNKQFVIGGASAQEQANAMIQLTQAMASGALRGEELNSILDGAPGIARAIERYMGIAQGSIKNVAAEGQVTAQVVKNALFDMAEETNAKFRSMSMTWEQVWSSMKNKALEVFDPILDKINEVANSTEITQLVDGAIGALSNRLFTPILDTINRLASSIQFQPLVDGIIQGLNLIAMALGNIVSLALDVGAAIYENWSWIAPVIAGVTAALLVYNGGLLITTALEKISNIQKGIAAVKTYAAAAANLALADAERKEAMEKAAATAAQYGFNAALLSSPIFWIISGIVVLISVIYIAVAAFNHFAGASVSATGIIVGAIAVAGAIIGNIVLGVVNTIIGIGVELYNLIATFANFFANVFNDPVGAIIKLFAGLFDYILGVVQAAAGMIDTLLGSDLSGKLGQFRNSVAAHVSDLVGEQTVVMQKLDTRDYQLERFKYGDAWDAGYDLGKGLEDKVKGLFSVPDLGLDLPPGAEPAASAWEGLENGVKDTAGNTGRMADAMEISSEDLKYLRDIAERDAINEFTTAEIKVDMGGINNNVNSNLDLDGVVSYLEDAIYESMSVAAEGVHL